MKKTFLPALLLLGTLTAGHAAIFYQGTGVTGDTYLGAVANPTIYDGNPAYVVANTMSLSGLGSSVSALTLTLNISGGMNNGLYAYLVGPGGTTVTLLNQPGVSVNGFGATGAGMNITLSDAAGTSIQTETSAAVLSGTYSAAGNLAGFNGGTANGDWTIFFSDTLAGGGNATLNGWSLNVTASSVPEPVNIALGMFGFICLYARFRKRHAAT